MSLTPPDGPSSERSISVPVELDDDGFLRRECSHLRARVQVAPVRLRADPRPAATTARTATSRPTRTEFPATRSTFRSGSPLHRQSVIVDAPGQERGSQSRHSWCGPSAISHGRDTTGA